MVDPIHSIGVVVIGRNEAVHLRECLAAVPGVAHRVYVDSGVDRRQRGRRTSAVALTWSSWIGPSR